MSTMIQCDGEECSKIDFGDGDMYPVSSDVVDVLGGIYIDCDIEHLCYDCMNVINTNYIEDIIKLNKDKDEIILIK